MCAPWEWEQRPLLPRREGQGWAGPLLPCEPCLGSGQAGVRGTDLPEPPSTKHPDSGSLAQTHEGPLKVQRDSRQSCPLCYLFRDLLLTLIPPAAISVARDHTESP